MNATSYFDGLLWIDPAASMEEATKAVLPPGQEAAGTAFPCRIIIERKRMMDRATGRRVTRDVRIGHFLIWADDGASHMGRNEARAVLLDAKAHDLEEIVVYGQTASIASQTIDFRQFGVRDIASIPGRRAA